MSRDNEVLEQLLSAPPLPAIVAAAGDHDGAVFLVGGAIRDALLSRPHADIDIAVTGDLDAFVAAFANRCGRHPAAIGDAWRDTRRTQVGGVQVDIGALLGSCAEDLSQRDFTINAMALRLDRSVPGELIDPYRGVADIGARLLRMVSDRSLPEDPLRALRAIRYLATLGDFAIEDGTLAAIAAHAAAIEEVAAERVQGEWQHLLGGVRWAEAVRLAFDLGVGERTFVGPVNFDIVAAWEAFERAHSDLAADVLPTVRLASLLGGGDSPGVDVEARLGERRWPTQWAHRAARIGRWAVAAGSVESSLLIGWALEDHECAAAAALLARSLGAVSPSPTAGGDRLERYAVRAGEPMWVVGADLISWGMTEGQQLGDLLDQAARGQLERRWDSRAAAQAWARARAGGDGAEAGG